MDSSKPNPGEVTLVINSLERDANAISSRLLPLVYDELRELAASHLRREADGHTLQATALVHEAWIRLSKSGDRGWHDRGHFFRVAARAMRRILVEHARRKACDKRSTDLDRIPFDESRLLATGPDERILLVDTALNQLEEIDPEAARVVDLRFFGGYTTGEIAEILGISERSVDRLWNYARARLMNLIRGQP